MDSAAPTVKAMVAFALRYASKFSPIPIMRVGCGANTQVSGSRMAARTVSYPTTARLGPRLPSFADAGLASRMLNDGTEVASVHAETPQPSHVGYGLESAEFHHLLYALHQHARFRCADKTSIGPQKHWKASRASGVRTPLQEPIVPAMSIGGDTGWHLHHDLGQPASAVGLEGTCRS